MGELREDSITSVYRELESTETRCTLERGPWAQAANKGWTSIRRMRRRSNKPFKITKTAKKVMDDLFGTSK